MAEEPYGTFFPENIGPLFTSEIPGQNPVLARIGRMYQDTNRLQTPTLSETPKVGASLFESPKISALSAAPQSSSRTTSSTTTETDLDQDLYDLYKPSTRAQDAYDALIKGMPQRPKPSLESRIVAGLSTLGQGGLKQAENVKYAGYNREMADWSERADRLKELADMERAQNTNNRMILNSALTERRVDRRQTETERRNKAAEEDRTARTALMQFRAANPNSQFIRLGNGNWGVADPQTNQIVDSGVKYGLSPLEDILMERESTAQRQANQAEIDRREELLRQQHRIEIERLQAQLKEAYANRKDLTPEQQKVAQFLIAQEVFNTDPDAKPFLTVNETGANTFTIKMPNTLPGWTTWGAEKKRANAIKWIEINKKIYGQTWQPPKSVQDIAYPSGSKPAAQATPSARPESVPKHYIKVQQGDVKGWIDPKEFDEKTMKRVP
jgi:hypothetical protein